jgi:hypothetical protein
MIRKGLGIRRKTRGLWAIMPFFLPRSRQGREAGRLGPAAGGGLQGPTAAGDRGKKRMGARGFNLRAHLQLGRRVGMDRRRRTEGGGDARGGGEVELGEGKRVAVRRAVVRCGGLGSSRPFL